MADHVLILVPQLPIRMRYSEWWIKEFEDHLSGEFDATLVLGAKKPVEVVPGEFSCCDAAIVNEAQQVQEYLGACFDWGEENITLLHCDLSYPGIFSQVLFHHRPGRSVAICHATSRNRYDVFAPVRAAKWRSETAAAMMYDVVVVASEYHRQKLGWGNVVNVGALPDPPDYLMSGLPGGWVGRRNQWASVARLTIQKTSMGVEEEVSRLSDRMIHHPIPSVRGSTWKEYYEFLARSQFLVITAREETYGYQVIDALMRGCIPIAPRAFSYPELLPNDLLYDLDQSPTAQAEEIIRIAEGHKTLGNDDTCSVPLNHQAIVDFWCRLRSLLLNRGGA